MPKFCIIKVMKTSSSSKIAVIIVSLVLAIGALAYAAFYVYQQQKPIDVAVSITDAQRAEYEAKIAEADEKLKQPDPNNSDGLPNSDYYIQKALYLGYLGHLSQAEAVLKEDLKVFKFSTVAEHNLARLYEQMGKYDKALAVYEKLVDETVYNQPQYFIDVARMDRLLNDVNAADVAYHLNLKKFNSPDAEFEQWLRDNKK